MNLTYAKSKNPIFSNFVTIKASTSLFEKCNFEAVSIFFFCRDGSFVFAPQKRQNGPEMSILSNAGKLT